MTLHPSQSDRLARAATLARGRGPSEDAMARMRGALQAAAATSVAPAAMHGRALPAKLGRSLLAKWLGVAAIGGAAAVGGGVALHHHARGVSANVERTPAPLVTAAPPAPLVTAPQARVEAPSISVDELPRAAAPPVLHASAPAPKPATTAAESELALVQEAQAALASDPARALSLAERHETEFPRGELAQERELVAIDALAKLGRASEAEARARRFFADNPNTPYRLRVQRALGHSR